MSAELTLTSTNSIAFASNMRLRPQQLESRLVKAVMADLSHADKGDMFTAEFQGSSEPQQKTGRAPASPEGYVAEDRRVGFFEVMNDGKFIDTQDQLNKLADPTSGVVRAMLAGKERARDRLILRQLLGNARTGRTGETITALPAGQIIGVQSNRFWRGRADDVAAPAAADRPLTPSKLREAAAMLDDAEMTGDRYIAVAASDLQAMLTSVETTSNDFNTVKALVNGEIDQFMDFKFIRLPASMFTVASNVRSLAAWVQPALEYRSTDVYSASVQKRADRSYTPYAYYEYRHGAVRAFDTGVVQINSLVI
jgi:hypothetical protein